MNQIAVTELSYSTLPLASLVESTTNPRRTFDPEKLTELAQSILTHGLIQPITVRLFGELYEIVAGARRYRAAQLAELEIVPVRILELSDAQALEVQIVENSQRQDVHPYEEAAGYQRLLELPGYDAGALASKCGKSLSHIYARLSLLSLIPEVVEAFQQDNITAAHANLLARLTPEQQERALKQCWAKDPKGDLHLLAARHLGAWIRQNLCLPLAKAPFDREDAKLFPEAGSCLTCPKRTGFNEALFCDFQDDQCLDGNCYQMKVETHIKRELADDDQLIMIETEFRTVSEHTPGSLAKNRYRMLESEPDVALCENTKNAIVVYGASTGTKAIVCTDTLCDVHNEVVANQKRREEAARNAPPPTEEQLRKAHEQEERKQKMSDLRKQEEERARQRRDEEYEAKKHEREVEQEKQQAEEKKREAKVRRIMKATPESLSAAQLRVLLRALLNGNFNSSVATLAAELIGENEDDRQDDEEVVTAAIEQLSDKQVAGFAVRLALGWHANVPLVGDVDYLAEAEAVFLPKLSPKKSSAPKHPDAA